MSARLPTPGSDDGTWGDILNAYLEVSLASDGTLRSNVVGTSQIQAGSVTNAQLDSPTQATLASVAGKYTKPGGGIPGSDLTSAVQTSLGKADNAIPSSQLGAASGVATLDGSSTLTASQVPSSVASVSLVSTEATNRANADAAHLAATDPHGDRAYANSLLPGLTAAARSAALSAALGVTAETFQRVLAASSSAPTNGTIYLVPVGVLNGDVITNLILDVLTGATAAGQTLAKLGLYNSSGTLLASTADQGHAWETAGVYSCALSGPYTVTATGALYIALVSSNSTTGPTLARVATQQLASVPVGSAMRPLAVGGTGQSTLPSSVTVAQGIPTGYWFGWS